MIDKDILEYVTEIEYNEAIKELKNNKFKKIYEDHKTSIKIIKRNKRIYTFINHYGSKKLDEALNNICSLAV